MRELGAWLAELLKGLLAPMPQPAPIPVKTRQH